MSRLVRQGKNLMAIDGGMAARSGFPRQDQKQ